jgi:hypothetical protein
MLIKENVLRDIINKCLQMDEGQMNEYISLLTEESTWIDEKTQQLLQLKADQRNYPLNSLTSLYRHGLAKWLKDNRYQKGKMLHKKGLEYVNDFIENKHDLRLKFKSDWKKVIKHRLRHDPRFIDQSKEYFEKPGITSTNIE